MKKFLLFCAALCTGLMSFGQLEQVVVEEFTPLFGGVAGQTTYRVYADMVNSNDLVSAVYAIQDCHPLNISTTTAFFNEVGFAGTTANDNNPLLHAVFPTAEVDSYITIGAVDNTAPGIGTDLFVAFTIPMDPISGPMESDGSNIVAEDGAWFSLATSPLVIPSGPDNRVMIGQFTTDGELSFDINLQCFLNGDQANRVDYVYDVNCNNGGTPTGFETFNASLVYPAVGCADTEVTIDMADTFGDGWNGNIYEIFDNNDPLAPVLVASGDLDNAATGDGTDVGQDIVCLPDGCYTLTVSGGGFPQETSVTLTGVDAGPVSAGPGIFGAYDIEFTINTASCPVAGCTDITACNYDPAATVDDSSCIFSGQANDQCANAIDLGSASTSVISSNVDACFDTEDGEQSGVFYSFTLNAAATVSIETVNNGLASPFDTQLALFDACGNADLFQNDDGGAGALSLLDFACGDLAPGSYLIMVDGFSGAQGDFELVLTIDEAACVVVDGCTDATACNYNPAATNDDGSCIAPVANDLCADAIDLGSATTTVSGDNTAACQNEGTQVPDGGCNTQTTWCDGDGVFASEENSVWYTFTMPAGDAEVALDLSNGFDSQIALLDGCGGNVIAANDDANPGFQAGLSFACGALTPGTQYWVLIDGYNGASGTFDLTLTIDEAACSPCNDTVVEFVVDGGEFPSEVFFDILDDAGNIITSGNGASGTFTECLADGCYVLDMVDSFGDGWNGASITVNIGGSPVGVFDVDNAEVGDGSDFGADVFSVGGAVCGPLGCTDDTACNYDPAAGTNYGCNPAPCNENPGAALALDIDPLGTCNGLVGEDLGGAGTAAAEGTFFTIGSGNDLWYSFVPTSSGVRIEVATADFDAMLELQDAANNPVNYEDAIFVNGGEILNIGNLVAGDTYFLRVTSWEDAASPALFDVCVQSIPDTRCDYGAGPYDLCNIFKADWVGADDYIFNFTSQTDGSDYSYQQGGPNTFLFLADAGLPYDDSYDVAIDAVFNLTDGAGNVESIVVVNDEPCALNMDPQPVTQLRASDNQANFGAHFLGGYVGATPYVCGAVEWEWSFVNTDGTQLPISYLSGSANRFIQLAQVGSLLEGAVYETTVRPVFAGGVGSFGPMELLAIVGPAEVVEIESPVVIADDVERLDIVEEGNATLYPNPNNGELVYVNITDIPTNVETVSVDIFDVTGKRVAAQQIATTGTANLNVQMSLTDLNSGMYIVNITVDGKVSTERLTISK